MWSVSFRYCPHLRGIFEFSWALCVFLFHPSMLFDLPSHHPQRTASNNSSGASQHCPLLLVPHHMLKMTITKPLICCGILFELWFSVHSQPSTVPVLILLGLLRINNLIKCVCSQNDYGLFLSVLSEMCLSPCCSRLLNTNLFLHEHVSHDRMPRLSLKCWTFVLVSHSLHLFNIMNQSITHLIEWARYQTGCGWSTLHPVSLQQNMK